MKRQSKQRWINTGGPFTDGKKVTHPTGGVFFANVEEIPKAFRDTIKPFDKDKPGILPEGAVVDNPPEPEKAKTANNGTVVDPAFDTPGPETVTKYEIQARGGGWYDVLNLESKKPMNEEALRVDAAKELLKGLCG